MSMLGDTSNVCDRAQCGDTFPVGTGITGTVDGQTLDFCEDCTELLHLTICGGCGELMEWESLNHVTYRCDLCERAEEAKLRATIARHMPVSVGGYPSR